MVVDTQVRPYFKTHQTHIEWFYFIACKLHLKKLIRSDTIIKRLTTYSLCHWSNFWPFLWYYLHQATFQLSIGWSPDCCLHPSPWLSFILALSMVHWILDTSSIFQSFTCPVLTTPTRRIYSSWVSAGIKEKNSGG